MSKKKIYKTFISVFVFILMFMCGIEIKLNADDYNESYEYYLTVNVDEPLTIEEIVEAINLQAMVNDESVTDYIVCTNDSSYIEKVLNPAAAFQRELGVYEITFEVTSAVGVSSNFKIYIDVKDLTAPKMIKEYSKTHFKFTKSDVMVEKAHDIIVNSIMAFDNCSLFEINKYVQIIAFDAASPTGIYNGIVYMSDDAGNESEYSISIEIVDDVFIRFTMNSAFTIVSCEEKKYSSDFIESAEIKAYGLEGETLEVKVKNDNDVILDRPGIYFLEYVASDNDGNYSITKHIVNVIDTNKPQFTLDESKVYVVTGTRLSHNDFDTIIRMKINDSRDYVYEVINDQYSESDGDLGQYEYEIELTYLNEDGDLSEEKKKLSFIIEVLEEVKTQNNEPIWYLETWDIIKKIGQKIIAIIKWPISFLETYF